MLKFISSKGFKIILLIVFIFVGNRFYSNYKNIQNLRSQIIRKEAQLSLAKENRQALQEELENLDNLDYIEIIARQELGLVKPGELLIIPIEEEKQ